MRMLLVELAVVSSLLLTACGRKESKTEPGSTNTSSSGNPVTAPVDYLGAVGQAKKHAEKVIDTSSISKAIDLFQAQEDRFPTNLNELVTSHYLGALPAAPYGMKYKYDPQSGKVSVVNAQ